MLDVNVLFALAWPNHDFHRAAVRRMETPDEPWATCAITQLGFIRLCSNKALIDPPKSPAVAAALLAEMTKDPLHRYLETMPAPIDPASLQRWNPVPGHQKVTDAYLVRIAEANDAKLLTFDRRIAGLGGKEAVEAIPV